MRTKYRIVKKEIGYVVEKKPCWWFYYFPVINLRYANPRKNFFMEFEDAKKFVDTCKSGRNRPYTSEGKKKVVWEDEV